MTLEELKERKRELGYSNEILAERSGVPLSTVQKVMSGITRAPRMATLQALEAALQPENGPAIPKRAWMIPAEWDEGTYLTTDDGCVFRVSEEAPAYGKEFDREYTIKDLESLPEGVYAELIDGKLFFRGFPTATHQRIVGKMYLAVANYIQAHGGTCEVFPALFGVIPDENNPSNYFLPDIMVICDPSILRDDGCYGAPDWIVEVASPATKSRDYILKQIKYRTIGVKEYWIINPAKRVVNVYVFSDPEDASVYTFDDEIPCSLYPDLRIRVGSMA